MSKPAASVISRIQNEIIKKEWGIRHWSAVELHGPCWFQVEVCVDDEIPPSITTFILPDIHEALSHIKSLRSALWADLRLYARMPLLSPRGYILETVRQVLRTDDESHIFVLKSGLILCDPSGDQKGEASLTNAREIYCKKL